MRLLPGVLCQSLTDRKGAIAMTENEAITYLGYFKNWNKDDRWLSEEIMGELVKCCVETLKEIQLYREIGTVEELKNSVKEEDVLKFYYCESEDDYYIGKRIGNFYYARYGEMEFEWFMSRYLPWGEHVVRPDTLWKEHTYPSKPKETPFFEWLQGFLRKYCGGAVEECREAENEMKLWEGCH